MVFSLCFCGSCPFAFTGKTCSQNNDPKNCTNQNPPKQPCFSGTCVSKVSICNGSQSCGYPADQIDFNCGSKKTYLNNAYIYK